MSVRWISNVWENSPYNGKQLLLHLALADFANDEGTCFPSQRTLALKARTTEEWVRVSIRQMVSDGLLEIIRPSGGRGNRTVYRLLKPPTQLPQTEKPPTESPETPKNDEADTTYKNRNEPSIDLADAFDRFWKAYPRKVAKVTARNTFRAIMKKQDAPTVEVLLAAVDRYKAHATDPRYIAHPTTWLRQGRWMDETEPATTTPARVDPVVSHALSLVVPLARLGRDWEDCLDALRDYQPEVISQCRDAYEQIRRQ